MPAPHGFEEAGTWSRPVKYLKANPDRGDHVRVLDQLFGLTEAKHQ